jgi:predicted kinase
VQRKVLIMGLQGAGKTTLATALAPLLNAVVFNADAVRANLSRDSVSATKTASSMRAAWAGCATASSRPVAP